MISFMPVQLLGRRSGPGEPQGLKAPSAGRREPPAGGWLRQHSTAGAAPGQGWGRGLAAGTASSRGGSHNVVQAQHVGAAELQRVGEGVPNDGGPAVGRLGGGRRAGRRGGRWASGEQRAAAAQRLPPKPRPRSQQAPPSLAPALPPTACAPAPPPAQPPTSSPSQQVPPSTCISLAPLHLPSSPSPGKPLTAGAPHASPWRRLVRRSRRRRGGRRSPRAPRWRFPGAACCGEGGWEGEGGREGGRVVCV